MKAICKMASVHTQQGIELHKLPFTITFPWMARGTGTRFRKTRNDGYNRSIVGTYGKGYHGAAGPDQCSGDEYTGC